MRKKYRDIVVDGQTYGWIVKFCMGWGEKPYNSLRIYDNKKVIKTVRIESDVDITPKSVEEIIRKEIL